jgi:hypothetical protein
VSDTIEELREMFTEEQIAEHLYDYYSLLRWINDVVPLGYAASEWPGPENTDNPWPRTPRTVPLLILPKRSIPADLRWAVWERDNFTCQFCGTRRRLSVDHIIPESQGGKTELDNLQTLCVPCNSSKGTR